METMVHLDLLASRGSLTRAETDGSAVYTDSSSPAEREETGARGLTNRWDVTPGGSGGV